MIKADIPLPTNFSPTIMPLTLSLFLQLAVTLKLHMATMDIKAAYPYHLTATGSPKPSWNYTSPSHAAWIPTRNTE